MSNYDTIYSGDSDLKEKNFIGYENEDYTNPENWNRRQGITAGVSHVFVDLSNVIKDEEILAIDPDTPLPETEEQLRDFILSNSEYTKDEYNSNKEQSPDAG